MSRQPLRRGQSSTESSSHLFIGPATKDQGITMKKNLAKQTHTRRFHTLLEDLVIIASWFAWNAA